MLPNAFSLKVSSCSERAGLEIDLNDANNPLPKAELIERAQGADGVICLLTDTIDGEVISAAPNLKAIANVAVGYNNIDVDAASQHQVLVTNTPDVLDDTTADLTFALLLAAARRIPEAHTYTTAGKFDGWELFQPHLGFDVWGKNLGIVGDGQDWSGGRAPRVPGSTCAFCITTAAGLTLNSRKT